jgi:predicted aspartyl protease
MKKQMIFGKIDSDLNPIITIKFRLLKKPISFEIDTGFSSYLLMPSNYLDLFNANITGEVFFKLSDGSFLQGSTGHVEISWFGEKSLVPIVFTNTPLFLIGRKLLENTVLTIDFKQKKLFIAA